MKFILTGKDIKEYIKVACKVRTKKDADYKEWKTGNAKACGIIKLNCSGEPLILLEGLEYANEI